MKNLALAAVGFAIVVFIYSTISQFKLLLITNFLYGAVVSGVICFVAGYRYAKKRYTSTTRL